MEVKVNKRNTVIALIVAIGMLFSFGVQKAMADDGVLFPYFVSGGGAMTFIQVLNTAAPDATATNETLHYTYVYTTATETCRHYDDSGKTSQNDTFLYEVTGQIAGSLLPGDTTSTSPILTVNPATGYLVIAQDLDIATGNEGTLYGQAYVVGVDSGTVFAYNGINDPDEVDAPEFYANVDDQHYLTFMPTSYATTLFYFFPVNGNDLDVDGNQFMDTFVTVGYNDSAIYDNNESAKSGSSYLPVGCWDSDPTTGAAGAFGFFFYSLDQIMSGAQFNAVKGTGGWADDYYDDYGYTYKIMASQVLGSPMQALLYEPQLDGTWYSYTK
jgi:hypothetical protein